MENRQWVLDTANLHSVTDGRCTYHRRSLPQLENRQWVVDTADLYTLTDNIVGAGRESQMQKSSVSLQSAPLMPHSSSSQLLHTFSNDNFTYALQILAVVLQRQHNIAATNSTFSYKINLATTNSTLQQQNCNSFLQLQSS